MCLSCGMLGVHPPNGADEKAKGSEDHAVEVELNKVTAWVALLPVAQRGQH